MIIAEEDARPTKYVHSGGGDIDDLGVIYPKR